MVPFFCLARQLPCTSQRIGALPAVSCLGHGLRSCQTWNKLGCFIRRPLGKRLSLGGNKKGLLIRVDINDTSWLFFMFLCCFFGGWLLRLRVGWVQDNEVKLLMGESLFDPSRGCQETERTAANMFIHDVQERKPLESDPDQAFQYDITPATGTCG